MGYVKVAAGDNRLAFCFQAFEKRTESVVPGHAHVQASELVLRVGRVDVYKPKTFEFESAYASFRAGFGHEVVRLGRGAFKKVGRSTNGKRLLAAEHGCSRISLALGIAPGLKIARQIEIHLSLLQFCFLQGKDIGIKFLRDLFKAGRLLYHGAQAVNVPRGKMIALGHGSSWVF